MSQHWRRLFAKENADFFSFRQHVLSFHSHEYFHCGLNNFFLFLKTADCVTKPEPPTSQKKSTKNKYERECSCLN